MPSMYGNPVDYPELEAFSPLGPGWAYDDWWFRGPTVRAAVPQPNQYTSLPAGGTVTLELGCNAYYSTWPYGADPEGTVACDDPGPLHADPAGLGFYEEWVAGCALGIADVLDPGDATPDTFTVFSVNHECVVHRNVTFSVPARMPKCTGEWCICGWLWQPQTGTGNAYMTPFRCTVEGSPVDATPIAPPQDPVKCAGDEEKCTKGAKRMLMVFNEPLGLLPRRAGRYLPRGRNHLDLFFSPFRDFRLFFICYTTEDNVFGVFDRHNDSQQHGLRDIFLLPFAHNFLAVLLYFFLVHRASFLLFLPSVIILRNDEQIEPGHGSLDHKQDVHRWTTFFFLVFRCLDGASLDLHIPCPLNYDDYDDCRTCDYHGSYVRSAQDDEHHFFLRIFFFYGLFGCYHDVLPSRLFCHNNHFLGSLILTIPHHLFQLLVAFPHHFVPHHHHHDLLFLLLLASYENDDNCYLNRPLVRGSPPHHCPHHGHHFFLAPRFLPRPDLFFLFLLLFFLDNNILPRENAIQRPHPHHHHLRASCSYAVQGSDLDLKAGRNGDEYQHEQGALTPRNAT
ncbi:hypothetical protein JCM8547_003246 [Rhodosporidiobolus lusitaniae]